METYKKSAVALLLVMACSCQVQKQINTTHSEKSQNQNSISMSDTSYEWPTIKYKTTAQNANPFDIDATENFFFYDGVFSCLVDEKSELLSFRSQSNAKVVFEMERLELVQNGTILKQFIQPKDFNASHSDKQFMLLSNEANIYYFTNADQIISTTSYQVAIEGKPYGGLSSVVWDDYDACRDYAKKFSQETGKAVLVCHVLSIFDRH